MKRRIKLAFCDFWQKFDPRHNYFTRLLANRYDVEISDRPDFVIFSCFGREHRRFRCSRIFYSGENWRPDYRTCDWAFTFDHSDDPRHFRLPLYALYGDPNLLIKGPLDPQQVLAEKTRFCNFIYTNPLCRTRNRFFHQLSKYKRVDSGGRLYNNIGGRVADKLAFVRQSKFTIAFENESRHGYTTEKLSQPMAALSLPIYWGNPQVGLDFNSGSFINVHDQPSIEAAIERVMEIDRNDDLYLETLRQPWYHDNRLNRYVDPENVLAHFERIFQTPQKPLGWQPSAGKFHWLASLSAMPQSMRRYAKRKARKLAFRLSGV